MEKKYGYTYNDSSLASQQPKSEKDMLETIKKGVSVGAKEERYQVYELVPVKLVTKTVTILERVSE